MPSSGRSVVDDKHDSYHFCPCGEMLSGDKVVKSIEEVLFFANIRDILSRRHSGSDVDGCQGNLFRLKRNNTCGAVCMQTCVSS